MEIYWPHCVLTCRWQAIVQGAVQHGLAVHESLSKSAFGGEGDICSGIVQSRRVRESYGVSALEPYFAELHSKCKYKVYFSMLHGAMMCPGRMQWFIKKVAIHHPQRWNILDLQYWLPSSGQRIARWWVPSNRSPEDIFTWHAKRGTRNPNGDFQKHCW